MGDPLLIRRSQALPPLVFRADGSPSMGAGHLMRCLALAQGWMSRGGKALFICRAPASLTQALRREGAQCRPMTRLSASPSDISLTAAAARQARASWVVIDGYQFSEAYERAMVEEGFKVLRLEDGPRKTKVWAHAVLNAGFRAGPRLYPRRSSRTEVWAGPRFALFRRPLLAQAWTAPEDPGPSRVRQVLVALGGNPVPGRMERILSVLRAVEARARFLVLAGIGADAEKLRKEWGRGLPARFLAGSRAGSLPRAAAALSAGGVTALELAFLGVPSLLFEAARNQRENIEGLTRAGASLSAGLESALDPAGTAALLEKILDPAAGKKMAARARALFDGCGVERVVARMAGDPFYLRPVFASDSGLLLKWANDRSVRSQSFRTRPIKTREHKAWLAARLRVRPLLFYMARDHDEKPVGQIRFDPKAGRAAAVSLSVDRAFRGRGLGVHLIRQGTGRLFRETSLRQCEALVRPENPASRRAFLNAGYRPAGRVLRSGIPAERLIYRRPA